MRCKTSIAGQVFFHLPKIALILFVSAVAILLSNGSVEAFNVYSKNDLRIVWDNTVKYSFGFRLEDQDKKLLQDVNKDDGDRNFDPGLISHRLDILSECDVIYKNFGFRVSASGWADSIYHEKTDNDSSSTSNSLSVPSDEFTDDTSDLHGLDVDLLDAFVLGKTNINGRAASIRVGRHTLLWGETLFLAGNGIAGGQAPIDAIKMLGVPKTQAKELFMPVGQVSGQIQLFQGVTLGSFYQFEWQETRIPAAGSYFSDVDFIDEGGESYFTPAPPDGLGQLTRGADMKADDNGQFGVMIRYNPDFMDVGLGFYYLNYHEKNTYWSYIDPVNSHYYFVYPENIQMVGASFSTQVGPMNVSGEVSARFDQPLLSTPAVVLPGVSADNDNNNLYALGDTIHANVSGIYFLTPSKLWDGGTILWEVGYHEILDETENKEMRDPTRDDYAWGFRTVIEPAFYQVFPGIDIKVPIGIAYVGKGASPVDLKFNGGAVDGGDISLGLNVDYNQSWKFGLAYNIYYGDTDYQTLGDRDYLSLSVSHTF